MAQIHPTAIIEEGATYGKGVVIGPYSVIGSDVQLGNDVHIHSHTVIVGKTTIGDDCEIYPFSSLGNRPQHIKFKGKNCELFIGDRTILREGTIIHVGIESDETPTTIGSDCYFMNNTHIGHNCVIEDKVIMAPNVNVGGHCHIGENVFIGGLCGIHQFVRIGKHAMIGGVMPVVRDVIPFALYNENKIKGVNIVGLKKRDFSKADINAIRASFKLLNGNFANNSVLSKRADSIINSEHKDNPHIIDLYNFLNNDSNRGYYGIA